MDGFIIKDSGDRMQFDSGMQRDTTEGKTLWSLIYSGPMLERWAEHLTAGAQKYGANNWLNAEGEAELQRFRDSAARHFAQWMRGDRDEDHAAAVFFNLNGAEYVLDKMRAASEYDDVIERAFEQLFGPREDVVEGYPVLDMPTSPELELVRGTPDLDDVDEWLQGMIANGSIVVVGEDDNGETLYGLPEGGFGKGHSCDCSPAIYRLTVTQDGPLFGRTVNGSYSKCNEEWYAWPPGTDPRGGIVYDLPADGVEIQELIAESLEALLDQA